MGAKIRNYRPGEERVLYDICLLTGDSGADASGLYRDPLLLGEVYVGPYLRFAPSHAWVGVDARGVAGYVLGVPDTLAFEAECERSWWPALRARYPLSRYPADSADGRIVRLIHNPSPAEPDVVERYPAHLHIDLLPRLQGQGDGRRLLTTLLAGLAAAGAPGVHLGVSTANQRAVGFYRRMGFTEVRTYADSLVMARQL
ncbi:GNAT family N-acetyltransferase [Actinophytocola sp.]|uniref:GNAT family N-acetyltransferase n=1 Tax=Actinophytocola sp. TaxID=1872138 RepID=UPI003899CDEE